MLSPYLSELAVAIFLANMLGVPATSDPPHRSHCLDFPFTYGFSKARNNAIVSTPVIHDGLGGTHHALFSRNRLQGQHSDTRNSLNFTAAHAPDLAIPETPTRRILHNALVDSHLALFFQAQLQCHYCYTCHSPILAAAYATDWSVLRRRREERFTTPLSTAKWHCSSSLNFNAIAPTPGIHQNHGGLRLLTRWIHEVRAKIVVGRFTKAQTTLVFPLVASMALPGALHLCRSPSDTKSHKY